MVAGAAVAAALVYEDDTLKCEDCGRLFPAGYDSLIQHCRDTVHMPELWAHEGGYSSSTSTDELCMPCEDDIIICPVCERHFGDAEALMQHCDATGHGDLVCGECGKVFVNEMAKIQHQEATGHSTDTDSSDEYY